jgi:hypothetical protein
MSENPIDLVITGDVNLVASFEQLYSLTVQIDPTLGGAVLPTPDQNYYAPGADVEVEALAAQSYGFSHWIYESAVVLDNPTTITFGNANEQIFCQFGVLEGEPDCGDGYVDMYNGGCNSTPTVFQAILPDQVILGTTGVFNSGSTRDTDWFEYEITDNRVLTFTGVAECDLQLALVDGDQGCLSPVVIATVTVPANDTATISETVDAGLYWLFASVGNFSSWPCPQNYKCWFIVEPVTTSAIPSQGRPAMENELSNIEESIR